MIPLWLSIAGGLGAVSRFVADGLIRTVLGRNFPWATMLINAGGSLLLGILIGLTLHHQTSTSMKLIWGTGFCGGFTTFSTATFEVARLIEESRLRAALFYILGSLVLTLGFCGLGIWYIA